ncbi:MULTISPECIES: hypothetical protein [Gluconobacter]|nr:MULTISPECIES: hypothetical protein [Gluconobacter]MBF0862198.1 hypothetical protein [Gluconobacter kanchanaburiensis]QQX91960.1 hypothetical protein IGS75_05155 [Gluconobacter sphaericus]GBR71378.1 hypothetical protein AA103587_2371 [Gluconobacter kanchanaburiensis NBRC 103587]
MKISPQETGKQIPILGQTGKDVKDRAIYENYSFPVMLSTLRELLEIIHKIQKQFPQKWRVLKEAGPFV